jgi:hypothetical protein
LLLILNRHSPHRSNRQQISPDVSSSQSDQCDDQLGLEDLPKSLKLDHWSAVQIALQASQLAAKTKAFWNAPGNGMFLMYAAREVFGRERCTCRFLGV